MAAICVQGLSARVPVPSVQSLLRHRQSGAGRCIAVYGTGAVAHVAIRIAHATGAEVSVLSPAISATDRLWLGADHYFSTLDPMMHRALEGAFDLIVCTAPDADIPACLALLKLNGALLILDAPATSGAHIRDALAFCGLAA